MQNNKTHILKPKKVIETKYNDVALIKVNNLDLDYYLPFIFINVINLHYTIMIIYL